MKSVLMSIRPRWCEKIANGKKTVEVRKNHPNLETPFKVYIYCTKAPDGMITVNRDSEVCNRKVIGQFVCDRISRIVIYDGCLVDVVDCETSCLSAKEILDYSGGDPLYGWHISDLVIYDKPKDLCEFYKVGTLSASDWEYQLYDGSGDPSRRSYASYLFTKAIRKPPQSWCYVEDLNGG